MVAGGNRTADPESDDRSIRAQLHRLASDHLSSGTARLLDDAAEVLAAGIAVGDDPVVLTDAVVGALDGLWVLTREQCLWEPAMTGLVEDDCSIDRDWVDAIAVDTITHPDGHAGVTISWPSDTITFDRVGEADWANELTWTVRQLAQIDGPPTHHCPACRFPISDIADGRCRLCGTPLSPTSPVGGGTITRRLDAAGEPPMPAGTAAAEAALADAFPWVTVVAIIDGVPVIVVCTDAWLRAWDESGSVRLDLPLGDVAAVAEPFEEGWEVAVTSPNETTWFLTGFTDPGRAQDVADRISSPAQTNDSSVRSASTTTYGTDLEPSPSIDGTSPAEMRDVLTGEIVYTMDDYPPDELSVIAQAFADSNIPHRWDGVRLVVPADAEHAADALLDALEQPGRATVPSPSTRPDGPQYLGKARVGEYWTVRHFFDAGAYVIAGIALILIGFQPEIDSIGPAVIGVGCILYGLKIVLIGGSYWVSTWVYLLSIGAVAAAIGALSP